MDVVLPLVVFLALGAVAIGLCLQTLPPGERAWLSRVLFAAFALRLAAATLFALIPATRVFHEDANGYEWVGLQIARGWSGDGPPLLFREYLSSNYGFYYVAAAIYFVLGRAQAAVSYFNALIGAITVFLVYRLARQFFHALVARRAAQLVAFIPSMILWSAMALKDPLMSFLIVLSLSSCVQLKRRFSVQALLGTILPVAAVQPIRFYMVYFLLLAILGSLLFERGMRALTGVSKQLLIAGSIAALLVATGLSSGAQEGTEALNLSKVSSFRHGMATTANSGFASEVDVSTPAGAIAFLPLGIASLLLAPFPWQLTSLRSALTAPEMLIWWSLIPALLRGLRFAVRRMFADTSPLLLFASTLTFGYSLMQGNVGAAFRQRAQIFVLLFIFAAVGVYQKKCRRAGIDEGLLIEGGAPSLPPPTEAPAGSASA